MIIKKPETAGINIPIASNKNPTPISINAVTEILRMLWFNIYATVYIRGKF